MARDDGEAELPSPAGRITQDHPAFWKAHAALGEACAEALGHVARLAVSTLGLVLLLAAYAPMLIGRRADGQPG